MEHMDVPLSLAAVLVLVAANGFFVATEFALVSVRRTRIEQLAATGDPSAHSVLDALNHLDAYIAATQLGITMASLALGWIGEPALAHLIEPLILALPFIPPEARSFASHSVAVALAFTTITALHIVLGELAPKSVALQRAESTALFVARPIHLFLALFRWPINALNGVGNAVVRVFGIHPAAGHALVQSAEELKLSLSASRQAGLVTEAAQEMVERALNFADWEAHHLMVPRTEIVAVAHDTPLAQLVDLAELHQHSRYPVYEGSIDNIIGILSAKRLLRLLARDHGGSFALREFLTPPLFLPRTIDAYPLLAKMKQSRSHMVILIDEYGGTAGLVTQRDLIAPIAGDLPDDTEQVEPEVQWRVDGSALIDGLTLLSDVEKQLGMAFPEAEFDTIGGFVFGLLGHRPTVGDVVQAYGYDFRVEEMDGLRIARVLVVSSDANASSDRLAVFRRESSGQ
jgi:CBS domain containing-hemolysin-like protein